MRRTLVALIAIAALLPGQDDAAERAVALAGELGSRPPVRQIERVEEVVAAANADTAGLLLALAQRREVHALAKHRLVIGYARLQPLGACDRLVALLADRELARFAAEGLGLVGDPRAFEPLAEWWQEGERDLLEFTAALRTLVELDTERLLPLLLKVLSRAPLVQLPAIEAALQRCPGAPRRVQPLLHSRDLALQGVAIRVLASSGDARATIELVNVWEREPELRVQLAQAFVTMRAHSLANMLLHSLTVERDEEVRAAIVSALRALADARVAREAIRWLPHERDPRTRILLITLAGERGDAEAIPLLVPLLRDLATTPQVTHGLRTDRFPGNVHVSEAAALAILRLRGLSNLPFEKLSRWPMRGMTATWPGCEIPALERWWAERSK